MGMTVCLVSLGCDKNLTDSEEMIGLLVKEGYRITDDLQSADAAILNTCCFIGDAREESIEVLLEMADQKETGSLKKLIVTGCMAQRYQNEICSEIPQVDAVLGTGSYDEILTALREEHYTSWEEKDRLVPISGSRILTTGGHYAYLKIAEGCDKHCTYCAIPSFRGRYRSYPMGELIAEAKRLVSGGVSELILVAQETTVYGKDLDEGTDLVKLLCALEEIEGLHWIRLLYCYPEEITDELIGLMAASKKICHYLDLPIQHCNDRVLKAMGRRTTGKDLMALIGKLREQIPDICLRTTLICGFPGETDAEHEELLDFMDQAEFDRLGAFCYSREEDTPAASFNDQIPEDEKAARKDAVMALQQEICAASSAAMIGRVCEVFIEGYLPEDRIYVGRTYRDAPNVDGFCFVHSDYELMSGEYVSVLITDATDYDLIGTLVEE